VRVEGSSWAGIRNPSHGLQWKGPAGDGAGPTDSCWNRCSAENFGPCQKLRELLGTDLEKHAPDSRGPILADFVELPEQLEQVGHN
jgi:hypothetical protein